MACTGGMARLVLHRADPDLSTLTISDVEELRDAIRSAATIPGIPEVLGDRLDTTRLSGVTEHSPPASLSTTQA